MYVHHRTCEATELHVHRLVWTTCACFLESLDQSINSWLRLWWSMHEFMTSLRLYVTRSVHEFMTAPTVFIVVCRTAQRWSLTCSAWRHSLFSLLAGRRSASRWRVRCSLHSRRDSQRNRGTDYDNDSTVLLLILTPWKCALFTCVFFFISFVRMLYVTERKRDALKLV